MTLGIYQIENKINGKIYIGSCSDENLHIEGRIEHGHFYRLRRGTHPNPKLQYAWNKYGEENFSWSILQEITDTTNILEIETEWLHKTKCYETGYNIAKDVLAPMKGRKMSEEAKAKIGSKHRNRIVSEETRDKLRNRIISKETRRRISEAVKGRTFSEEQRINLSRGQYKRYRQLRGEEFTEEAFQQYLVDREAKELKKGPMSNETREQWREKLRSANLGKKLSLETREKMRQSQRARFDKESKKVVSEESRKKMSEAQKNRFKNKEERDKIWAKRKK